MTKKPLPSIARSVGWPVFSMLPCVKIVPTRPMRVPRPILPALPPPPCADSRSANSVRLPLKPTVFTFAMLLPITLSDAPVAMRPLRAVDSAPKIAMTSPSGGGGRRGGFVNYAHVGERDPAVTDEQHGRTRAEVDAGHAAGHRGRDRRAGRVLPRGGEVHVIAAVAERRSAGNGR